MTSRDTVLAALTSIVWGLAFVATRFGLDGFTATQLIALRFLIAAMPVLFLARPALPWHRLVAIGLTLFVGQFLLLFLAYRAGMTVAVDRLLIAGEDVTPIKDWAPPAFPFSGGALVERGLSKGPDVAAMLRRVETQWIAEGFPDAARVGKIADDMVANAG